MSPEQLRGETLDARSDLFSLGLVLYEMATGRPAFTGATSAVISAAILHEAPRSPRQVRGDLPQRLEEIILEALEKDREVRCQTASALRADLKRLKRELDSHPGPSVGARAESAASLQVSPAAIAPAPSSDSQVMIALVKRHRGGLATFAVLVVAALAGGMYMLTRRQTPPAFVQRAASHTVDDEWERRAAGHLARREVRRVRPARRQRLQPVDSANRHSQ